MRGPLALLLAILLWGTVACAEGAPERTVILDTTASWRVHHVFAPPVVDTGAGLKSILAKDQPWFHKRSDEPPTDWREVDFDDSAWLRGPSRIAAETSLVARVCLRGKFTVTDPSKVDDLRLTLGYFGGVVVYLNGKELKRGHLKPGEAGRNGLGEIYPADLDYPGSQGSWEWTVKTRYAWEKKRVRTFDRLAVPSELLRKGVNVLAIEVVRPVEPASSIPAQRRKYQRRATFFDSNWHKCSVRWVRLSTASGTGIVQNAVRPEGLQVWNSNLLASDFDMDFGDTTEALQPIRIVACRNGAFSGKVVVGCDGAIHGLKASVGALAGPGVIPSTSVRVRLGVPWGSDIDAMWRYVYPSAFLGALETSMPDAISVVKPTLSKYYGLKIPDALTPRFGAVRSVWVTVHVPKQTPAGTYAGTLTIRAAGHAPVAVPVRLTVEDWTLPDTDDWVTWVELMQSVDTLALEWDTPLWSEAHWRLIAQSMRHLNRIGSRILYIPVICYSNLGNRETMVRWTPKADGTYAWDFSVMDRYVDTALAHMGKPKVAVLWVWDKFLYVRPDDPRTREYDKYGRREAKLSEREKPYLTKGPAVTMRDAVTGKLSVGHLPTFREKGSRETWRDFLIAARRHLAARGIRENVMLGTASDVIPRPETLKFFKEIAPDLPWVAHSHNVLPNFYQKKGGRLGYYTTVFGGNQFPVDPEHERYAGWRRGELQVYLLRNWHRDWDTFPVASWRHLGEVNIAGNQRGVGHLGADFWYVLRDKRGNRRGRVYFRYPEGNWRSNDICTSLLAPGRDGPIATVRYEMMREGIQECEARIFIEKALLGGKLDRGLAKRCRDALDDRIRTMMVAMSNLEIDSNIGGMADNDGTSWWNSAGPEGHKWFIASGWEARTRRLFALAGEVARKLEAR